MIPWRIFAQTLFSLSGVADGMMEEIEDAVRPKHPDLPGLLNALAIDLQSGRAARRQEIHGRYDVTDA